MSATEEQAVRARDQGDDWTLHAVELADWTDAHMVNRRDAYGSYLSPESRTPERDAITAKGAPTLAVLQRHYRASSQGDLIGLHSTTRDEPAGAGEVAACWCRWLAVDIDRHDEATDPAATIRAALAFRGQAEGLGFRPLLLDSNGRGGYHLLLVFTGPAPTAKVHAFGKWLVRDWKGIGLEAEPETFPKQAEIPAGGFGNWLRLPGRHHSRDHHTRVWDGLRWLDGSEAVRAILATKGDDPGLIPAEALAPPKPKAKPKGRAVAETDADARLASEALNHLDPSMPYPEWLQVGMALTQLGRDGLALWDSWSSGSEKYQEGLCDRKWRSFARDGVKLGTLFHMAKNRGFEFSRRTARSDSSRVEPGERPPAIESSSGDQTASEIPPEDLSSEDVKDTWPVLGDEALHGIAGEIVRSADPHTEADPVAVLIHLLIGFANAIGRGPYWKASATRHYLVLFAALVGPTASGRKGTAWGIAKRFLHPLDTDWAEKRISQGLTSGEGLIYHVRDPVTKLDDAGERIVVDPGEADKRLMLIEPELGRTFKAMGRDSSTLSAVMREAWDCGDRLATLAKNSTNFASNPHISLVGHITAEELRCLLSQNDTSNGLANRFLWICARRSKELPGGGEFDSVDWAPLTEELRASLDFARGVCLMRRNDEAEADWRAIYGGLTAAKPGLLGKIVARAEAQAMRLACVYALLDRSPAIQSEHLDAALALIDFVEDSARYVFGDSLGDPNADKLLSALKYHPEGFTRSQISTLVFKGNAKKDVINKTLQDLLGLALIHRVRGDASKAGPTPELWRLGRPT